MEYVVVVIVLGGMLLWGIHEREERLIAQKGYKWYISSSRRWKKKRKECFRAFGYRCAECNSPYDLQAHHRRYDNLFNEKPIRDLTCLCATCHQKAPKSGGLYRG